MLAGGGGGGGGGGEKRTQVDAHPLVRLGCTAGFLAVAATVFTGAYAAARGRRELSRRMVRYRLVALAPTLGLYVTGTGFLPPPAFFDTVAGRAPRIPRSAAGGGAFAGGATDGQTPVKSSWSDGEERG